MMARLVGITGLAALGGCATQTDPGYRVADVLRIDDDLVNILVEVTGPDAETNAPKYAECVAAQFAVAEGYGFARNVRTATQKTGGTWTADAVYTISQALPQGSRTIDAEVVVQNCAELGIPTG